MKPVIITGIFVTVFATAVPVCAKDVKLTWDASQEPGLDHYEVFFAPWLEAQKTGPFQKDADVPAGITDHTVMNLDDATFYAFQVYAVNSQGLFSYASNIATDQTRVIPKTVTGVAVSP